MWFFSSLKKSWIIKVGSSSGSFSDYPEYDPLNQNFVKYGKDKKKAAPKWPTKKPEQKDKAKTPWRIAILWRFLIVILAIRGLALDFDKTFVWWFWGIVLFRLLLIFCIRFFIKFIKTMPTFIAFMFLALFMFIFPYLSGHDLREWTAKETAETKTTTNVDCDSLIKEYNNKVFKFTTSDPKLQWEFGITVTKQGDTCAYTRWVSFKLNEQLPTNYATVNRDARSLPQNYIAKVTYEDNGSDGFGTTSLAPAFCQKDKMPNPFWDWKSTEIYTSCTSQTMTNATSDVFYSHRSNESKNMDASDVDTMKRYFTASKLEVYDASAFVECEDKSIWTTMSKTCSINFDKTIESKPIRTYTLKVQE